ncbi:hemerythrin domain-containing protein [Caenimonas terrae]|uniref:Hemerythrin domain-containing protein n=1 Tax=Caenimonas terrae TaxID=696074 RepID=A0ABW0NIS9_9BURK
MSSKPQDAIELLDAEHRALKALFDDYRQLSDHKAGGAKRKALAETICMELTIHMRLEEEIFYPPVRDAIRDDDLLDEAEVEHAGVKELLGQILAMQPVDQLYDAKVTVLGEYIAHHVKEEREEMFPKVRKSGIDLAALGEKLRARREELRAVPEALREDALVSVSA